MSSILLRHLEEEDYVPIIHIADQWWGCTEIRCITAPGNHVSLAFHRSLGFQLLPGDALVDQIPVTSNYDGHGGARVIFTKSLC